MPSATLRRLLEERATAWSQVQDIQSRRERAGYTPSEEDGETYTRALDDVERLSQEIETEERAERLGRVFDGAAPAARGTAPRAEDAEERGEENGETEYRTAFGLYVRRGMGRLDARQQQLLEGNFVENRAQGVGTQAAGGYAVPTEFVAVLIEVMKAFGGILGLVNVLTTDSGAAMNWPTEDDTNNVGAILDENTQMGEQDATLGQATLGAYTYTSKIIRASLQFLQDAGIDAEAWLARKVGTRIARAVAAHLATGTGVNQPQGLVTGLPVAVTTAAGAVDKITFDDLIELEHSVDPAYRPRGRYVLADGAVRVLRKVKDGNQNYIWQPSVQAGVPSLLNGREYTIDNGIAAPAAGAKTVVFGDIAEAYAVRQVRGAQVMRLNERYADYLQVGFLGFQRWDAKVQNAAAAKVLQQAAA